ncbi:hypothetical protein [Lacisediminihabitans changchengi]|uniref:Uncharacterized protein n=1 Tax=Lacisediminihabitans changchengi TaxID=2787634 RepID=A0A934SIP1_9MICO|nr:hypothetical protein [Lacisediminihabitans changchengi]MBK4347376.1 hypothetical protein [Lacisediminihabitans changchengi]
MRRTAAVIALLIVPALVLSGCTPSPPQSHSDPKPSSTPLFASEEEALKAATEAYAAYLKVSDSITADAGMRPERIEPLVSKSLLKDELTGFLIYSEKKLHTQGETAFFGSSLERYDADSVAVYACVDFSAQQLIDSAGLDVTPISRVNVQAFELSFVRASDSASLLLDGSEPWAGPGIC